MLEPIIFSIVIQNTPLSFPICIHKSVDKKPSRTTNTTNNKKIKKRRVAVTERIELEQAVEDSSNIMTSMNPQNQSHQEQQDLLESSLTWYNQVIGSLADRLGMCCSSQALSAVDDDVTNGEECNSIIQMAMAWDEEEEECSQQRRSEGIYPEKRQQPASSPPSPSAADRQRRKFVFVDGRTTEGDGEIDVEARRRKLQQVLYLNSRRNNDEVSPAATAATDSCTASCTTASTFAVDEEDDDEDLNSMPSWNTIPTRQSSMSCDSALSVASDAGVLHSMADKSRSALAKAKPTIRHQMTKDRFWTDPELAEKELIRQVQKDSLAELPFLTATEGYRC